MQLMRSFYKAIALRRRQNKSWDLTVANATDREKREKVDIVSDKAHSLQFVKLILWEFSNSKVMILSLNWLGYKFDTSHIVIQDNETLIQHDCVAWFVWKVMIFYIFQLNDEQYLYKSKTFRQSNNYFHHYDYFDNELWLELRFQIW